MPQRHSKNNNDLAFFTYEEKRKLGYGTQRERLGKDSIKPFDACCLCLKPLIDPLCCPKGHAFCKECILECLLAQKKDIKRKLAAHEAQKNLEKGEEEEKLMLQKSKELEAFDQQNHGAIPQYLDRSGSQDRSGFHGANSVKVTSFEEEALRTMKAFWLPSATPEASAKVEAPSMDTICPEGQEKLKLKSLFPISFTEEKTDQKNKKSVEKSYMCPSCKSTLTNTMSLVTISTCGHVFCKKCSDKFLVTDKVCLVCNKPCKGRNLTPLEKGGTGFAAHDDHLEARNFKHLGSGSGLGLLLDAKAHRMARLHVFHGRVVYCARAFCTSSAKVNTNDSESPHISPRSPQKWTGPLLSVRAQYKDTTKSCNEDNGNADLAALASTHTCEMASLQSLICSVSKQLVAPNSTVTTKLNALPPSAVSASSSEASSDEKDVTRRRLALLGAGAIATGLLKSSSACAEEVPKNYKSYVDAKDGYSYLYPADWRDFDFLGHDSAFKDRNLALQCVRVAFIPTAKTDIRDLGPMDEAIFNLVNNVYAAPNQIPSVYGMQERTVDGKNYWTFEYDLEAPGYGVSAFATVAIGNGRYYTLIVTANERRWSRLRNKLKVVADSFKISELSA
ncbi:hypothetical protein ABZP36_020266 [Zizania latifolia]